MLTFTNPSLLPLLALLVPLAIHLWNRRPGREVAVGSLRWLAAGANRRLRNLRLEQLWLLLLRVALLAVLAAAVAGPAWRQPQPPGRGQVLVSPELAGQGVLTAVRPRIDSLRRRGYALRWLSRGLPLVPAAAWRADSLSQPRPATSSAVANDTFFYEQRIWQAADTFAGQPLYVLTSDRLAAMQGTHRPLPPGITWQTLPILTESSWLQDAAATGDSLHLLIGHSNERQTTFRKARVVQPQLNQLLAGSGLPALRYTLTKSHQPQIQTLVAGTDSSQASAGVPVHSAALRVWVYTSPGYAADVRYLRAALRAASIGLPVRFSLTVASTLPDTVYAPEWLFWLSRTPVPPVWLGSVRRGLHLWQAPPGLGTTDTTLLVAPGLADEIPPTIWRRTDLSAPNGTTILWADAQGRPVLTRRALGQGAIYQASTRLNSEWNTLPDNPTLPALLLDVLQPTPTGPALARLLAHDQRRLDITQLPTARRGAAGTVPPAFRLLDLRPWLVLLAGALLALERWLASRRSAAPSLSPA